MTVQRQQEVTRADNLGNDSPFYKSSINNVAVMDRAVMIRMDIIPHTHF